MDKNIKVAIVEDTDDIRDALRTIVNGSSGFECTTTCINGLDALRTLPEKDIDVILMDINMPGMNGVECVEKLKKKMPHTQFMMCTVYDDDESIFNALKAGATGYILKRTSPSQILEAIRELTTGGSPMSSEIARRVVSSFKKNVVVASSEAAVLSAREKEILDYMAKGFLYKEIADALSISKETVKKHIHNIYEKLQVSSRIDALNKVFPK